MCFLFTIKHPLIWCLWTHTWDTWSYIRLTLKYQSQWYVFSRRTNKLVNENCLTFHILSHYKTHHGYLMCLYWCMKHQWLWCYMPPAGYIWPWSVLCLKMNHNLIIVAIDSTNLWPKIWQFLTCHSDLVYFDFITKHKEMDVSRKYVLFICWGLLCMQ